MLIMDNQTVFIKDIRQGMKNLIMTVIVLDVGPPVQVKEREVRTLKVADGTASINLSLWGEAGNHIVPGDIVRLSKAHVNVYRNCLTLLNGKSCEIDKIGEFCMVFNEQLNMSEPNMELAASSGKNGGGPAALLPLMPLPPQGPPPPLLPGKPLHPNVILLPQRSLPPAQTSGELNKTSKLNSGNNGNKVNAPPRMGAPAGIKTNPPRPERR